MHKFQKQGKTINSSCNIQFWTIYFKHFSCKTSHVCATCFCTIAKCRLKDKPNSKFTKEHQYAPPFLLCDSVVVLHKLPTQNHIQN